MGLDLRYVVCDCGYGCPDGLGCMAREEEETPPRPNGVRVVHLSSRNAYHRYDLPRWYRWEVEPTRVRVCRGSRR